MVKRVRSMSGQAPSPALAILALAVAVGFGAMAPALAQGAGPGGGPGGPNGPGGATGGPFAGGSGNGSPFPIPPASIPPAPTFPPAAPGFGAPVNPTVAPTASPIPPLEIPGGSGLDQNIAPFATGPLPGGAAGGDPFRLQTPPAGAGPGGGPGAVQGGSIPLAVAAPTGARPARAAVAPLANRPTLKLAAKLTPEAAPLKSGLVWRVFREAEGAKVVAAGQVGDLDLVATSTGGEAEFTLDPGSYLVHAAFGKAGVTSKVTVAKGATSEQLVLNAGGLKLNAANTGELPIPADLLGFDILPKDGLEVGGEPLISAAKPGRILRLSAGTYQVVSRYGQLNAVVRSTLKVDPGKLTEAMLYHKAAKVSLKLVSETGGEALANTRWDIQSRGGPRLVRDMLMAFPSVVLAEGDYSAIAVNGGAQYTQSFTVTAGRDIEVELVAEKPK